jgi:hypothetical protein
MSLNLRIHRSALQLVVRLPAPPPLPTLNCSHNNNTNTHTNISLTNVKHQQQQHQQQIGNTTPAFSASAALVSSNEAAKHTHR